MPEPLAQLARLLALTPLLNDPEPSDVLCVEEDVVQTVQRADEAALLEHHPQAQLARFGGPRERQLLPTDANSSFGRRVSAESYFHERRLAGAIVTDECVDAALSDVEVHVAEHPLLAETHADVLHLQRELRGGRSRSRKSRGRVRRHRFPWSKTPRRGRTSLLLRGAKNPDGTQEPPGQSATGHGNSGPCMNSQASLRFSALAAIVGTFTKAGTGAPMALSPAMRASTRPPS